MDEFLLHVSRKARRDAVYVDFICSQALWLQKNLMSITLSKSFYFILNRGAVAGSNALDNASEHGRTREVFLNNFMSLLIGVRNKAVYLRKEREGARPVIE